MVLLKSIEDDTERQNFRNLIFNQRQEGVSSNWEDDDWVPPWFGTEEQNAKEVQAFANWTRKIGGGR